MPSSVDVVLLDTPGNLDEDNLLSLFQRMDYIITPFAYDRGSWDSLKMYRKALRILKSPKYEYKAHFEVFFILNKFDSRIGTAEEHAVWADMIRFFQGEGLLTPMIKNIAELKRFNTLFLTRKQRETVFTLF
jgi:chromosome partitioning protein